MQFSTSQGTMRTHTPPGPKRRYATDSIEVVFDGKGVTATTREKTATISLSGYSVLAVDVDKTLVVRGGTNFIIGVYRIVSIGSDTNTWVLDRACTSGPGGGMTGKIISQEGRWHNPVPEYYEADLPNNPCKGEARNRVLAALNSVEPDILKSLAQTCFDRALLKPEMVGDHDWPGLVENLLWGHVREAGRIEPSTGGVIFGNLKPLRDALTRWAKDEPEKRWDLCDSEGEPIDWVADAAVQTLVYWQEKSQLPRNLRWENLDLHCYRSLDSEDAFEMLAMERHFDAGSGFVRIAPEDGVESSRSPDRAQRAAKKKYNSLGQKLGLTRMQGVSPRYFEWYVLQTFLGRKLREIRNREFQTTRKGHTGCGVGDPKDPHDLSAISHGIKKVADLVSFQR
jgi:hypothetical protein